MLVHEGGLSPKRGAWHKKKEREERKERKAGRDAKEVGQKGKAEGQGRRAREDARAPERHMVCYAVEVSGEQGR